MDDASANLAIVRDIKADQRESFRRLDNAVLEQSAHIGSLMSEASKTSARVTSIEVQLDRYRSAIEEVKSVQDGCLARLTHSDDTTQMRELQRRAREKRQTPPEGGTIRLSIPASVTPLRRALLTTLIGAAIAALSAVATWFSVEPVDNVDGAKKGVERVRAGGVVDLGDRLISKPPDLPEGTDPENGF